MTYDLGDVVPLTILIRDASDMPANADSVVLTIGLPNGDVDTPALANPEPGRYQFDYRTTQAGRHTVRWVASGNNAAAHADVFDVRPATPDYLISLASAKDQCKIPQSDTSQDERLREFVEAAVYVIENHRKEALIRRTVTDWFHFAAPVTRIMLRTTPVISVAALESVDGYQSFAPTDLHVIPQTGLVMGLGVPLSLVGDWRGIYVAGRALIPANFTLAARIIVQHLWETTRGNTRAGLWPGGQDDTTEIYGMGFAIPNRALELLGKPPPLVA